MNALTVKASEAAGRVVVALAVPFVVLWVLLMFVLVFPVAAADWLYHAVKRDRTPNTDFDKCAEYPIAQKGPK